MSTEQLKTMKEQLMNCVQGQLGNLSKVNAHQLGEAIDMIKDLSEAIYYCTITDSMEKSDEKQKQGETNINYYSTPYRTVSPEWDYQTTGGYKYYSPMTTGGGNVTYYTEMPNITRRDPKQGRSPMHRRLYMQGKETHNDPNSQLRELQTYLQELSTDITEMIKDASPEERATLRQKMTTLANKIN